MCGGAAKNNPKECMSVGSSTSTPALKERTYSTTQADRLRGPLQLGLGSFQSNRRRLDRIPRNRSRCRLSATYFHLKGQIVPISTMSGKGSQTRMVAYLHCYVGNATRSHSI